MARVDVSPPPRTRPAARALLLVLSAACAPSKPTSSPDGAGADDDTAGAPDDSGGQDTGAGPPPSCPPPRMTLVQRLDAPELPARADLSKAEHGAALGDLDADGDLDALVAWEGGSFIAENDGTGVFRVDDTWTVDGAPLPPATTASLLDLDDDGDLDGFLGRSEGVDLILWNDAPGRWRGAPLDGDEGGSFAAAFGDIDSDGDLDLLISSRPAEIFSEQFIDGTLRGLPNHLYVREGDTFTWADERLPVADNRGVTFQAALVDVDNDGDLDIYEVNDGGYQVQPNGLWLNDGTGRYTVAPDCACERPMYAMGLVFSDWNADLLPDFFVSNIGPQLYLQSDGPARYVDMGLALGAGIPLGDTHLTSWGMSVTDLDRDGYDDIYVTFGRSESDIERVYGTLPGTDPTWNDDDAQFDAVLRALPDGRFEAALDIGLETVPGRQRGVSFGDLDGDGDDDAFVTGKHDVRSWITDGGCDTGLGVRIDGPPENPHGIGARVSVWRRGRAQTRWMSPGRYHGADDPRLLFGLAGAEAADRVEVLFPDGTTLTEDSVSAGELRIAWPR
jgi:hypothetical protein